ncbi:MAG: hypothetical protein FJ020_08310 [Chloroflexi bacterium]|nr:hypothetical protein [Chloroflexota bacterium]
MEEKMEAKLWVNSRAVDLNPFVEEILAGTVAGALRSLKGVEGIKSAELQLRQGTVAVTVNSKGLTLTPFPNDIIAGMVTGFVSALKGTEKLGSLRIKLRTYHGSP